MKTLKKLSEIERLLGRLKEFEPKLKLTMNHNAIYGGYRIDIIHASTGESFYDLSSRISKKEMVAYLRGIIKGFESK
jgi:hypothetical protein